MANRRYNTQFSDRVDTSGGGTAPAQRGVAQKALPEEKVRKRFGGKPYGKRQPHTADMPGVKTFVAGDY